MCHLTRKGDFAVRSTAYMHRPYTPFGTYSIIFIFGSFHHFCLIIDQAYMQCSLALSASMFGFRQSCMSHKMYRAI